MTRTTMRAMAMAAAIGAVAASGSALAADGPSLFARNCAYCHGSGGAGDGPNAAKLKPPPPDLTKSSASETAIGAVIRNGKRACPSWRSSLKEEEIEALARYAKGLQR